MTGGQEDSRGRWAPLALLILCFTAACYTYAPIQGVPPVGSDVRISLSDEEALRVSGRTGELSRTIDGRYTGAAGDTVFLSVATFRASAEAGSRQFRQSLAISREGLEGFASKELSLVRSGIVGGLAAGGMVLVIRQVVVGGSNDDGDGDGGNPTGTLIPIIRIPLGR